MTLKEKIAEHLYTDANPGAWEVWDELYPHDKAEFLALADEILELMSRHFGVR